MSNYRRSTRKCTFDELQLTFQQALRAYFIKRELIDIEAQIIMCCETISERKTTSTLAKWLGEDVDPTYTLAAFVTPEWLFWARRSENGKITVVAAKLKDIFVNTRTFLLVKDFGLEINGFVDGSFTKVSGYIAMGAEPVAEEFCKVVEQAVNTVHPRRRLMDIFGKTPS